LTAFETLLVPALLIIEQDLLDTWTKATRKIRIDNKSKKYIIIIQKKKETKNKKKNKTRK
jgi:hypothetical protein